MLGLVINISSTCLLQSTMMKSSSMSAVRNAPVMSIMSTSLFLCTPSTDMISNDTNSTVGGVASLFLDPSLWFWPYVHARSLTALPRFYLRKLAIIACLTLLYRSCLLYSCGKKYSSCVFGLVLFLLRPLQPYWIYWASSLANIAP